MTGDEAAKAIFDGVNAMFAEHATVEADECRAYVSRVTADGGIEHFVFVTFASGSQKDQGADVPWLDDLEQEVTLALTSVAQHFPEHQIQLVLWRREPTFEIEAAVGRSRWGPATPERRGTYFRLVGIPLGARKLTQADRDCEL